MARRVKGEGSIFQRTDGRWVGVIDLGWVGGKRVRRTVTAATLRELRPKFRALREKIDKGVLGEDATVADWLNYWLDTIAAKEVRQRTLDGYRGYCDTWLIPQLGKRRLDTLKPDHIRALHLVMEDAGRSPTTIRQAHMILRKSLVVAERESRILRNPAALVKAPSAEDNHHGVLTLDEAHNMLTLLAAHAEDGDWWLVSRYLMALLGGLRQGEALGLKWEDVDLSPGVEAVLLRRTVQRQKGKGLVEAPLKSRSSARVVPLLAPVAEAMRRHRETAPDGYVWGGATPTDPRRDWGTWKGLLWSADCQNHPLHAARATAASIMSEANVPLKTIADILGHAQITTAWAHYVHTDERQKREGLEAALRLLES